MPVQSRKVDDIDRGEVAIATQEGNFVSWRQLASDPTNGWYHLYRNNQYVASFGPEEGTCYFDKEGTASDVYTVENTYTNYNRRELKAIKKNAPIGIQEMPHTQVWSNGYKEIQLNRPAGYFPSEASVGDLNGDGKYELVLKWDPSNAHDNSQSGFTDEVFIDAYTLDGEQLWRIHLGKNIRAGAHYTQFVVYDLDNDGRDEVAMRTAPGTKDGKGKYVVLNGDNPYSDFRRKEKEMPGRAGYVVRGPEYLTVFDGETGEERASCPFEPARGNVTDWGDNYGNRVDRFLAAAAHLGEGPASIVMARGYYQRSAVAAFDLKTQHYFDVMKGVRVRTDSLCLRWLTIGDKQGEGIYSAGNHNWSVADIDGDGFDEIIHGACALDHDGTMLYNTHLGHGDAIHVGKIDPSRPGLQVMTVHEAPDAYATHGMEVHDALTGEILWGYPASGDNGRGCAADIDPNYPGWECWSIATPGLYDCKGNKIANQAPRSINFRIYWDGDEQDELLDKGRITKWNPTTQQLETLFTMDECMPSNGTKSTPILQADLYGDWREEVIMAVKNDPSKIRIYSTTLPSQIRRTCLMQNAQYRLSIVWQNCAYNQPPHVGEERR